MIWDFQLKNILSLCRQGAGEKEKYYLSKLDNLFSESPFSNFQNSPLLPLPRLPQELALIHPTVLQRQISLGVLYISTNTLGLRVIGVDD
nr:hypothetical protein [Nostoc sp. ChiQUE02]MDZ8231629.1 hypothetical protein [Nostoc sp. ChiQUE02]